MKNTDIGRNDPCPCGSGKKYKNCCIGRENTTSPSNAATAVLADIRKEMQDKEFTSLGEAQAFLDRLTQQRNQTQSDDFHGLSPDQMHRLLHFPFVSPQLVSCPDILCVTPSAPVITLFSLLMVATGEKGLKATATGNLPRNFCREAALTYWGEETYRERTRFGGINKEEDFPDLNATRLVAEMAGLVRKFKGRFILTRNCRSLMAGNGLSAIYPILFKVYAKDFNWAYRDRYPEIGIIQWSFLFTLYLLARYGDAMRPSTFYEDQFLRAFPMALKEVAPDPYYPAEKQVRTCYTWRTFVHFAGFFGLAEVEPVAKGPFCREYLVKSLPLLREVVQFHLTK